MHNRIGQNLYANESSYISKNKKKLKKGDLFCIKEKNEEGQLVYNITS